MMRLIKSVLLILIMSLAIGASNIQAAEVSLPQPLIESDYSLEAALYNRVSDRQYADQALNFDEISQLVWAAQGENQKGTRTAPSAGALYPIEVYVAVGEVESLTVGIYKYSQENHTLNLLSEGDLRTELTERSLNQQSIQRAPAVIILAGVVERTADKYGERGERYMWMEAGHVAQNILLQAQALELGGVSIGAFDDEGVHELMLMEPDEQPLYVIPVGKIDE